MSNSSRRPAGSPLWCWSRLISPDELEPWVERLKKEGCTSWAVTEKVNRVRARLSAFSKSRAEAKGWQRRWGGEAKVLKPEQWMAKGPAAVLKIGARLRIHHEKPRGQAEPGTIRLYVPHGLAFGSGEHPTTTMLLRALTQREELKGISVLDLGTGSGILALAARALGAGRLVGTDFDEDAVRTARANEELNFKEGLIGWQRRDVRRGTGGRRSTLVLANLFSGILGEAAGAITDSVAPGGELWLSGILKTQQLEVEAAYVAQGLRLTRAVRRGKWVMLCWRKEMPA